MAIEDIHSRGKLAIIAGGLTYIQSLLEGYPPGWDSHEEILAYRAGLGAFIQMRS